METIKLPSGNISYMLFGDNSKDCVVIEAALGSSCAEWWHLAGAWSAEYGVLVHDRPGYGKSDASRRERTPDNIAGELNELLDALRIEKIILVGHSLGGLYAYRFSGMFPERLRGLILLDPVSPNNGRFKKELTKAEFKKSGVDKSINLKLGNLLCSIGLGRLFVPMLKKSPPFYYYDRFTAEAEKYILSNFTSRKMYRAALREYAFIEMDEKMEALTIKPDSLKIPLSLVCHTPEIMKEEIRYYGNTDDATANKIEGLWLEIMREYLNLSPKSVFLHAPKSGHSIHLTDPEIIKEAIDRAAGKSPAA